MHRIPLSLLGRVCLARGADAGLRAHRFLRLLEADGASTISQAVAPLQPPFKLALPPIDRAALAAVQHLMGRALPHPAFVLAALVRSPPLRFPSLGSRLTHFMLTQRVDNATGARICWVRR